MKAHVVLLAALVAVSATGTAYAAQPTKHHHVVYHRAVHPATASSSDWPGNPYMDMRQDQVAAFWRDAFNPLGAQPWK
ncbi:MAG: hypothetical protein K2Y27_16070 [Xanthobacteraceae bacterium]|nr:hypothetical protein [Xanthobacteraceae bacterium]